MKDVNGGPGDQRFKKKKNGTVKKVRMAINPPRGYLKDSDHPKFIVINKALEKLEVEEEEAREREKEAIAREEEAREREDEARLREEEARERERGK